MNIHELNNTKFAELTDGYEYPITSFTLDTEDIATYLAAVNDSDNISIKLGLVPPLAVAARALAELSKGVISPPGTIHSTQELDFKKAVYAGEQLKLKAKVEKKLDRGDLHLLTTNFRIINCNHEIALTGKITVACRAPEARWLRADLKYQE